ncbi:hypothetical protein SAY87_018465 [Trapa incisa]|uniref:RPW8 domain-containing protein n=1 Tax=Trapa incisa TaxID=236973 RepID=A0AAN7QX13_9MYRT|nr:hypothetical protein SAY87_018465 [Trapa incisa]
MADLISGAVLGAVFAELLLVIKSGVKTTIMFRSRLKSLESTLESIKPIIKEIESLNKQLDRSNEEMQGLVNLMKVGTTLVMKSTKVNMNLYKMYNYSRKLAELENDIIKFFQIYLIVICRDNKEVLMEVKEIQLALVSLSLMIEGGWSKKGMVSMGLGVFESCAVPKAAEFVVGLNQSVQQLKKWLLDGGVSVKIVSAPGGCGKTTLVQTLCHDSEIKGKFKDNIFFVTVSQSPKFTTLVQNMIHHKGKEVRQIETEELAIEQLQQFLKEIGGVPVLLVLDDVWSESKSLLERFLFDQLKDYKILVTTRFELLSFGTPHKLDPLNHEDARKLFLHSVTSKSDSYFGGSIELWDTLIDEIIKRCKGSPLALSVVGKSLCGKHPKVWESKLLDWSEDHFVDSNKAIFDCLRRSLDDLDGMPVHKECFMDLGSFPEDCAIPVTTLIDMWIELHELDIDGIHAMGIIYELAARNLVNLIATKHDENHGDGFYSDLYIKHHDLLRELAIHENNQGLIHERKRLNLDVHGNKFPNWFNSQEEQTFRARLLSISTDETFSSQWSNMELPDIEVLVLNLWSRCYTLPPFINKMGRLKTLIVVNHGFFPAEISNLTILGSLPSLKRMRFERIKIPPLPSIRISNLQKASFFMCHPGDSMTTPNLSEIDISYCSELNTMPMDLCNVVSLRKINITSCHNLSALPYQIGNLSSLQVLRLSSSLNLSGLPESIGELKNLAILDISYCFSINKLPDEIGRLRQLKELHMNGCHHLSSIPKTVINLEQLRYVFCDSQRAQLWRPYMQRLPKMKLNIVQEDLSLCWLLN